MNLIDKIRGALQRAEVLVELYDSCGRIFPEDAESDDAVLLLHRQAKALEFILGRITADVPHNGEGLADKIWRDAVEASRQEYLREIAAILDPEPTR